MSEGWNNANCGDSSGTKMASVKQEEADGLGPQDAVMKNANKNETSGVNPQLQSWPFSEDIGQPVTTNSVFTQQLSLAGAAGSDQPYLLVNQSDASQGSLAPYLSYEAPVSHFLSTVPAINLTQVFGPLSSFTLI
jgi:hypothetical protein